MPTPGVTPDDGLLDENANALNQQFYAVEPWRYFERRLANLVLVAGDPEGYRALLADGVTYGELTFRLGPVEGEVAGAETRAPDKSAAEPEPQGSDEQAFVAIDSEILLHHSAETLLRFVHAHSTEEPCPWLRMSRLRSPRKFKDWVDETIVVADDGELANLVARVFAVDPNDANSVFAVVDWLRLFGRHFADSDSYNAAKHGMAIRGDAAKWTMALADEVILERSGATTRWLAVHRPDDEPPRWSKFSRVMSVEAAVLCVVRAVQLMEAIWIRARHVHLDEPWARVLRPEPPDQALHMVDARHPVLADIRRPLRYDGVPESFAVVSRHFRIPGAEGGEVAGGESTVDIRGGEEVDNAGEP